jgi:hypothetical protein
MDLSFIGVALVGLCCLTAIFLSLHIFGLCKAKVSIDRPAADVSWGDFSLLMDECDCHSTTEIIVDPRRLLVEKDYDERIRSISGLGVHA